MLWRRRCSASSRRAAPWTCCARCLSERSGYITSRVSGYAVEEALHRIFTPRRSVDVLREVHSDLCGREI